tara:strand:+ start:338 stop:922 length:585 start_codon:yes stop_codon:yes gene_type:complete
MFQNDISYVIRDIDEKDLPNISEIVKKLMEEHLLEGVAAPFFYSWEIKDLQEQLPTGWKLNIKEDTYIPENKIRLTVSNAYFKASRYFNPLIKDVELFGECIGNIKLKGEREEVIVLCNDFPYDEEEERLLFDLDYADGESPILFTVSCGEKFGFDGETFQLSTSDYDGDEFILGESSIEIINYIKETLEADWS